LQKFWRFLTSLRLAIGLIVALVVGSTLATLIPQGLQSEEYITRYPKIVATLVVETGLGHYFSSLLFLLPVFAFFFNLLACTINRLLRELKKKGQRRHGPDILHVGLLVLIVGSLVSYSERKEGAVTLRPGDSVDLPGGETLILKSFSDERYENGRPSHWISIVDLTKGGKPLKSSVPIRVNSPLRVGAVTIYQASYGSEATLEITEPGGKTTFIDKGASLASGNAEIFFMTVDTKGTEPQALLRVTGVPGTELVRLGSVQTEIGPFRAAFKTTSTTGLQAVTDPGYPVVLAGLILVALGTTLTFIRKLKELPA